MESRPGWLHHRVPLARPGGGPGALGQALISLPRIGKSMGAADLVHVHGDAAASLSAPFLGRRPTVITTHGLHRTAKTRGVSHRVTVGLLSEAIKRCSQVICTSEDERETLAAVLPADLRGRLVTVRNGTPAVATDPEARNRARAELSLAPEEVAIVQVGELEPRKDPLLTSRAVSLAAAGGVPMKLLFVGRGSLENDIRGLGEPSVTLLGYQRDVSRVLRAADIFVLPSRREGMSMALLEAMAHGLAIVASDLPGNREALADAGRIVAAGDVDALKAEITRLATNSGLRESLGEAARGRAESELSLEMFQERTFDVYEAALDSR